MNKKIILVSGLALASLMALPLTGVSFNQVKAAGENVYHVDFFTNYLRQDATLSNGTKIRGNNLLFKTVDVTANSLVSQPDNPSRRNYEFQGWYKEQQCQNIWNFSSDKVTTNTRLFAKWGLSEASDIIEPSYTPPSTVLPESASDNYVINSIMYFPVNANVVRLPTSALMKLEQHKDNVLPLMEYKVKASKTITATFSTNVITVTCNGENRNITVIDDSLNYVVSNSTYENKAKKYEANALEEESYHVMLAGSSSIEFWETSKEDLAPIVSYNHGIGGTTIEEWDEKLNQRLVLPYKPKMVVYYVGINNVINSKEDAVTISNRLTKFFDDTHAALPDTQVQYILMNQLPGYASYKDIISAVNNNAITYQANHSDWLTLINPGVALLKENGEPSAAYFRTDGLHLSYYGYIIWGGIIKESIVDGLEAMSK